MALLSLRNISMQFGGPNVLENVSLSIEPGERSCVTGRNGEGKSTLLKIIAGLLEPDSGEIIRKPGLKVAYLAQDVPHDRPGTVAEVIGGETGEAGKFISQLGLTADVPFNTLSGGMRRRVFLAAAFAGGADLVLLDEPTNHLDIPSIEWLEKYLKRATAACLFVTHDRTFLKHTATRVLDLDRGELAGWNCDYPTFLKRKAELLSDEAVYWARKERKLKEEEAWIRRGVKARTTRNEGRVQALMALRREFAARRLQTGTTTLKIDNAEASGQLVVKAEHVTFTYPGGTQPVIRDFTAKILRGERIGIVGENGAGKTTLLRLITGKLQPDAGSVNLGTRVTAAYLDQMRETLDTEKSVLENIAEDRDEVMVGGVRKHVYSYLSDFLFTPERARTPVKALSGGERARLVLAKRFMEPGNLLILDEPTNDLDIETLELLEEQLAAYKGTILLVSHDRTFLDNTVTSCFVLAGDGEVATVAGGYAEAATFLEERKARVAKTHEDRAREKNARSAEQRGSGTTAESSRPKKLSYNEQRELAALPTRIEELEQEAATIEKELADPEFYVKNAALAGEKSARLEALKMAAEVAIERWSELEERSIGK